MRSLITLTHVNTHGSPRVTGWGATHRPPCGRAVVLRGDAEGSTDGARWGAFMARSARGPSVLSLSYLDGTQGDSQDARQDCARCHSGVLFSKPKCSRSVHLDGHRI